MAAHPKLLHAKQTRFPTSLGTPKEILFIGLEYRVLGEKLLDENVNSIVIRNLE
jgi:hypothetical protein